MVIYVDDVKLLHHIYGGNADQTEAEVNNNAQWASEQKMQRISK